MDKIQIINPTTAYKFNEHKQLIEKINELVAAVNRLAEEPVPHSHREMACGGPPVAVFDFTGV